VGARPAAGRRLNAAGARSRLASASLLVLPIGLLAIAFAAYHLFDFHVFWQAGRDVVAGRSPYPPPASLAADARNYYVYPPPVALLATPLAVLPFPVAGALFSALLLAALVVTLRILGADDRRLYAVPLLWVATLQAIGAGTLAPLLVLGLAVAWRYRERRVVAALGIACVLAAKLFLWPVLVWLLATRRFAAASGALLAGAAVTAASWAAIGFAGLSSYPHLLRTLVHVEGNRSFSLAALARSLELPGGAGRGLLLAASLASVAAISLLARRTEGDRRAFAAAICLSLVLSPIVWLHYYLLLLVPIALTSRRLGPLWLAPAVLFLPYADSGGVTWRIALAFAVIGVVLGATAGAGRRGRLQARLVPIWLTGRTPAA